MTRVYVAAPLPHLAAAKTVATLARAAGLEVVSTWHEGTPTVEEEARLAEGTSALVARDCKLEVCDCDVLVLLYGRATERHGSVYEAGYADALGKGLVLLRTSTHAKLPTILLLGPRTIKAHETVRTITAEALAGYVHEARRRCS